MIRSKHDIDTKLVNFFVTERHFDDEINESLLNWYSSLGDKDHQSTRNLAIDFLKKISLKVLNEIDYPLRERERLISTFEPLEALLRTALALKTQDSKSNNVRDHLSHTIRNVLFTNYLLKRYYPENNSSLRLQVIIAAIFHDIAYPLEKIKKVASKLGSATFKDLLNSKGKIEIELNNPDDLLEILNYIGLLKNRLDNDINKINKEVTLSSSNEEIYNEKIKIEYTLNKLEHVYTEIICKAIAGIGLFDASHSISSVVMFLRPIIMYWKESKEYHEMNLDSILDICLAMTYHDRENLIEKIDFEVPLIVRIMRISDELQEWDRESNSYIKDVSIQNDTSSILSLKMLMKDKSIKDVCKPYLFIPDKIKGLFPIVNDGEKIKIDFEFPSYIDINLLRQTINNKNLSSTCKIEIDETNKTKNVELVFENATVTIK